MEAFVIVCDTGSFSGAARQLRIGQPAVSKAIAQLEEFLGVRLLSRSTHGLTRTESGQGFYEHAKQAIDSAEEAVLAARGAGVSLSGRLRVSAAVTFAPLHIMPHLSAFLDEHPLLDVDLFPEDRNVDLIEAGIDVALRMGTLSDSSLTARRIGQSRRLVLGTPAYFDKAGVPLSPTELAGYQAIIYDQSGHGETWAFERGAVTTSVTLRGRIKTNAAEGIREGVLSGLGLAVATEWMFAGELGSGAVSTVLQDWTLPSVDLWVVFPTGRQASAKARAFASFMESRLALQHHNE
jgi:DNA-binding transcriptional LysR family regulator